MTQLRRRCLLLAIPAWLAAAPVEAGPVAHAGAQRYLGTADAAGVAAFRGIAYARPPVGALRWEAPQPLTPATGTIEARRFAPACPQGKGNTRWYRQVAGAMGASPAAIPDIERIDEDCLYLNVWTTAPRPVGQGRGKPVMVWIHGGSNENGYSHEPNYLGHVLARDGVVVVSINYRLGLLGFLAAPDLPAQASGRFGILDQLAALRWIKANIAGFGGDPDRITLFGESAGGTDIAILASMPEAKGLIAGAIIQSGYLAADAFQEARAAENHYAAALGPGVNLAALRGMSWQALVALQEARLPGHFYAPVAPRPDRLMVPLLIGSNADEYLMYLPKDSGAVERDLAAQLAELPVEVRGRAASWLASQQADPSGQLDLLSSSKAFHCPSITLATATATSGKAAFVYRFTRVRPGNHGLGAYHGAEIPYVFGTSDRWLPGAAADRRLERSLQRYWIMFAHQGNPNGRRTESWPRWQGARGQAQALGDTITPASLPHESLCGLLGSSGDQ